MKPKKRLCATWPSKRRYLGCSGLLFARYAVWSHFLLRSLLSALCGIRSLGFAMRYALCALLFFGLLGCQATLSKFLPPLEEEGEVYLYAEPFPQEAERLRFNVEAIFAVSADGREFPLTVSLQELKPSDMRRQRLLAHGRLPPGSYDGFSFKVNKAFLKTEEGEANLLVPETPVRNDFPFRVSRKRAYVVSLTFKYAPSILSGFSFSPVFFMIIPARPIPSLTGYVSNLGSSNITVFDKKSQRVRAAIATGRGPAGMALDQRQGRVYVALSGDDAIELIDVLSGEVINRLRIHTGDQPRELALTPDGKTLLVANQGTNTVSFVDASSLVELGRVDVGREPHSISIHPNGIRAFVFNTFSNTVSVLDIPNKAVITTITTDPAPVRGQFNRRGDRLYIIHEWSAYLTALDPFSLAVLRRFPVRIGMTSIKVDPQTDLVYMGRGRDTTVEVYDPFSFVVVDSIITGAGITYMTIDGDENNLYMVNPEMKSVMVSGLVRKKVIAEMDVGESPYWVSMMGER
jgi:YVTN family beta-propeller protein